MWRVAGFSTGVVAAVWMCVWCFCSPTKFTATREWRIICTTWYSVCLKNVYTLLSFAGEKALTWIQGFFPHAFSICAWSYCCSSDKSSFLTSLHDLHACFHRTHSGGRRFFLYVRIKNKRMYQGHGSRFSNTKSVVDQSIEKSKKAILCHHNWMLFPGAAIFQYFTTQLSPYRIYIY